MLESKFIEYKTTENVQVDLLSVSEILNLADAEERLICDDVIERLSREGSVKKAPFIENQAIDKDRNNLLKYIVSDRRVYGASTPEEDSCEKIIVKTEQDSLKKLCGFLKTVSSSESEVGKQASKMLESISFIGNKEFNEASAAMAVYWMSELDNNEELKIAVVSGAVAESGGYVNYDDSAQIKSDEFFLENILSFFSDDDILKYRDRLMIGYDNSVDVDPSNLKVIFLDDWVISGSQLSHAIVDFIDTYPDLNNSIEVHLAIADEQRIKEGLSGIDSSGNQIITPVKAYYTAHDSPYGRRCRSHITGFHSSTDYDFEDHIALFLHFLEQEYNYKDLTMPPLTNIVRPYRNNGVTRDNYFLNMKRYRSVNS